MLIPIILVAVSYTIPSLAQRCLQEFDAIQECVIEDVNVHVRKVDFAAVRNCYVSNGCEAPSPEGLFHNIPNLQESNPFHRLINRQKLEVCSKKVYDERSDVVGECVKLRHPWFHLPSEFSDAEKRHIAVVVAAKGQATFCGNQREIDNVNECLQRDESTNVEAVRRAYCRATDGCLSETPLSSMCVEQKDRVTGTACWCIKEEIRKDDAALMDEASLCVTGKKVPNLIKPMLLKKMDNTECDKFSLETTLQKFCSDEELPRWQRAKSA